MKPRVRSVTTIPNARPQRTPQPTPTTITEAWPRDTTGYNERPGRYLPGQLGRFPTVGLDPGAMPGTRADTSAINNR